MCWLDNPNDGNSTRSVQSEMSVMHARVGVRTSWGTRRTEVLCRRQRAKLECFADGRVVLLQPSLQRWHWEAHARL